VVRPPSRHLGIAGFIGAACAVLIGWKLAHSPSAFRRIGESRKETANLTSSWFSMPS